MLSTLVFALALGKVCLAHGDHGDHGQKPVVDENASWMTKHMAEEHHADTFDAGSFFALHDYNSDGQWEPDEILRTYGLFDESNKHVTEDRKKEIVREVLRLADNNKDAVISKDEFDIFMLEGGTLPDLGTGPGHHGDDEYEYEIHHWELYHDENTKLEDLTHPEDIEHFKKHEEMEDEQDRIEELKHRQIVEENIPNKFRRSI
ncbi:hypothetical protein KVR01_010089 [Diaporthe batatas]|uniref:uncharacterized protein n=1 Tax=Diaporthe batatas TaxID=748121 RepID=UPI001D053B17|nr:uncharacterized protein KVR01_010089 [Diaporthe batatas]KAG8160553.1 hypothetical protein KVR01_010089 [Diaporthe batatas]